MGGRGTWRPPGKKPKKTEPKGIDDGQTRSGHRRTSSPVAASSIVSERLVEKAGPSGSLRKPIYLIERTIDKLSHGKLPKNGQILARFLDHIKIGGVLPKQAAKDSLKHAAKLACEEDRN